MDLPFPSLPFRVLHLISEYSKPLTRPDWRTCNCLIPIEEYIYTIRYCINHNKYRINIKLLNLVFNNIAESEFYMAYNHIYFFGIDSYVLTYNLNREDVLSNKKLNRQHILYINKYIMNF
jgi:hypothetical protein